MCGMAKQSTPRIALSEVIAKAGSRPALMKALNERGHKIKSPSVIGQWLVFGVPAPYAPDIEDLYGVTCERLCPKVKWGIVRRNKARAKA